MSKNNSMAAPRHNNSYYHHHYYYYSKKKEKNLKTKPKLLGYLNDEGTNKTILYVGRVWKTKEEKRTEQWAEELEP